MSSDVLLLCGYLDFRVWIIWWSENSWILIELDQWSFYIGPYLFWHPWYKLCDCVLRSFCSLLHSLLYKLHKIYKIIKLNAPKKSGTSTDRQPCQLCPKTKWKVVERLGETGSSTTSGGRRVQRTYAVAVFTKHKCTRFIGLMTNDCPTHNSWTLF